MEKYWPTTYLIKGQFHNIKGICKTNNNKNNLNKNVENDKKTLHQHTDSKLVYKN